jgi:hypothetical protein
VYKRQEFYDGFYNHIHQNVNDMLIVLRKYKNCIKYTDQPDAIIEKFMYFDICKKDIKDIFDIININILCEENAYCYDKLFSLLDSIEDLYNDNKDKKYKFLIKEMRKLGAKRATEMNKNELQQNCYKKYEKEYKSASQSIIHSYYYNLVKTQIEEISEEIYEDIDYIISNTDISKFDFNDDCINKKSSKIVKKIKNIHKTLYSYD